MLSVAGTSFPGRRPLLRLSKQEKPVPDPVLALNRLGGRGGLKPHESEQMLVSEWIEYKMAAVLPTGLRGLYGGREQWLLGISGFLSSFTHSSSEVFFTV